MAEIQGTNKNDTLRGTAGADKIYGYDGDDIIYAKDGDDEAYGGAGNDTLYGGAGNDTLYGGAGNDILGGGAGNDIIYGGEGSDTLYGGTGDDLLIGGAGADTFYGGDGIDTVSYETYFYDISEEDRYNRGVTVYLDNRWDTSDEKHDAAGDIFYDIENVKGSIYNDYIYGDSGDNIIWGNGGNDNLVGFSAMYYEKQDISYLFGNDTFYTDSKAGDRVSIRIGLGNNIIYGGDGDEHVYQELVDIEKITADMVFGKNIFDLGEGNNEAYICYNPIGTDITAGNGDNRINIIPGWSYGSFSTEYYSNLTFGAINIELGNGQNTVELYNNFGDANVTTGSGDDTIRLYRYSSDDSSETIIDAGDGDNAIQLYCNMTKATITVGDGNNHVSVTPHLGSSYTEDYSNVTLGTTNIELGNGQNYLDLYNNFGDVNVATGGGDDYINFHRSGYMEVNLRPSGEAIIDAGDGDNSINLRCITKATITAGNGDDEFRGYNEFWDAEAILPAESIYVDLGDGNNTVHLESISGNINIVTGSGDDRVRAFEVSGSNINVGGGNDTINIFSNDCDGLYITGGQGSDTYEASMYAYNISTSNIINNYDTDGGFDILKLTSGNLDSYSAIFKDNDLIISHSDPHNNGIENTLVVENYTLGSDYQIDQFNIGGAEYTSDQFLAEMGLSL